MSHYIRSFKPGGTFFFTVVSDHRRPFLTDMLARYALRCAIEETREKYPFHQDAIVLLPEHIHCIWTLPEEDTDFSLRWKVIKHKFTRIFLKNGGKSLPVSHSRQLHKKRGLWQRRFWEHTVRNEKEFETLCNYIHYNPVKHGHASCPHIWPFSTFAQFVKNNLYPADWLCTCKSSILKANIPQINESITGE
jgi:putative transposase